MENSLASHDCSCHGIIVKEIGLEKFEVFRCVLQQLQMGGLLLT
jgi:hypothetical protein